MKSPLARPAIGMFIGATLVLAASASATQGNSGWYSSLFSSTGGPGSASSANLVAAADAAMNAKMQDDLKNCDDVGIGASIKTAIDVHGELAAATPNVESLFDVNSSCFSSVAQLIDLSSSIPSWQSIIASAEQMVLQYAQKKACSAVSQVSGMVTTPINQVIGSWNQLGSKYNAINGSSNSSLSTPSYVNPQLGTQSQTATATNYVVNTNPFGATQTTFSSTNAGQQATTTAPVTGTQSAQTADTSTGSSGTSNWTSWAASLFN